MPKALFLVSAALVLHTCPVQAEAADSPAFHPAGGWMMPFRPAVYRPVLPGPDTMSAGDRIAVETILLEAAGDGFASMVAVGEAIRNRTALFGKSVDEVCLQPKQFSGWNDRSRAAAFLAKHRSYYSRAWLAWRLSGATSLTGGATDYHTESIRPYWAPAYTPSARVGSHIYYVRQARRIRE